MLAQLQRNIIVLAVLCGLCLGAAVPVEGGSPVLPRDPKGTNAGGACSGGACSNGGGAANGGGTAPVSTSSTALVAPTTTLAVVARQASSSGTAATPNQNDANKGINSGGACSGGACAGGGGAGGSGANDGTGDDGGTTTTDPTVAQCDVTTLAQWIVIRQDLALNVFQSSCGAMARAATRLAFHDAGTFSLALQAEGLPAGGADGSMLTDPNEVLRSENDGLQGIVAALQPFAAKYGVSNADILHTAGALSVVLCPGGPQVTPFFLGRKDTTNISPTGHLPDPTNSVDVLIALFADMGLNTDDLVALIGSHSTATQQFVNSEYANAPLDSSPAVWDSTFYAEAITASANTTTESFLDASGVFRLQSDLAMAQDSRTSGDFSSFAGNQNRWQSHYAASHSAMSILGQDPANLVQCEGILPAAQVV